MDILSQNVNVLKGIGKRRAQTLSYVGIFTLRDVLNYFPRTYIDLSKPTLIAAMEEEAVYVVRAVVVSEPTLKRTHSGLDMYTVVVKDESGEMEIMLFNQGFTAKKLEAGKEFIFYGKARPFGLYMMMTSPLIEDVENAAILPVYPLTQGLSQKIMRTIVLQTLEKFSTAAETLPSAITEPYGLQTLEEAYENIHFPKNGELLHTARQRLIFEEFFEFFVGTEAMKRRTKSSDAVALSQNVDLQPFYNSLAYELTGAQKRVIAECLADMQRKTPMARIVQGDVGSGKTVVAAVLMLYTVKNGAQACMMVPTSILAVQHYKGLSSLFEPFGVKTALLTSATTKKQREKLLAGLKSGEIDVLIGTHSLIQKTVEFSRLALTVTDEQHRFGVRQRSELSEKGLCPHRLIMSATPIPRTLALIMYGDLSLSVIDELPPGRQKISTFLVDSSYHARMYKYLREQVSQGAQAYIVCPLVEEGEDETLKSAVEYAGELTNLFLRGVSVKYLHGKMSSKEKEETLQEFSDGKVSVLVSTTVIEVGVDVQNATVMIIENAERFGLAQLHQLRGRVGRGSKKSYCFLVSDTKTDSARERMHAFCKTNNGFEISQKDLEMRGPGEFLGKNQSGEAMFKVANLVTDLDILRKAQGAAKELWKTVGWFKQEKYLPLRSAVSEMFRNTDFDIFS